MSRNNIPTEQEAMIAICAALNAIDPITIDELNKEWRRTAVYLGRRIIVFEACHWLAWFDDSGNIIAQERDDNDVEHDGLLISEVDKELRKNTTQAVY